VVGNEERILEEGEWSDWVTVPFDLIPTQTVPTQALFYLKQVRPHLHLYVSPLNLDPLAPAMPISTPDSYAAELGRATGRYYTQGMPEDTGVLKAGEYTGVLKAGVLEPSEFLEQAHIAMREFEEQLPWFLNGFDRGLLFYYVGNGDLVSHMMWRSMDPDHPAYDAEKDAPFADVVPQVYEKMDKLVGFTLDHMGDDTLLIVMSDHGFTSWRRTFHLNAWLHQNGYLAVKDETLPEVDGLMNVDWSGTRAYGVGLNSLYINLAGRERDGTVPPEERDALLGEIAERLESTIDPETGQPAIARVHLRDETYCDGGAREVGPDATVAYTKGTRGADESALGEVGREFLKDNDKPWSGDHGMNAPDVPGILATSRPLRREAANLQELHASVLAEFGIEPETGEPADN
jgi:predicted AlkP superfamily phosphohydrolase/phosphomutase